MVDYATASLAEIKAAVLADGVIDAEEAASLKARIMADGEVDREEADFLFDLNDVVSGGNNDPAWHAVFVDCITAHVLNDADSPGVLDADEWQWLKGKIEGDGQVDELEKRLLKNIVGAATKTPEDFQLFIRGL